MSWYYAENGAQKGPLTEDEFQGLLRAATVRPETLVWQEGMADWLPYARVLDPVAVLPGAPPPLATVAPADAGRCAECGGTFVRRDMVAYADALVCAGCRDVFFQKVREGVTVASAGALVYAGFWIRVAAMLIDMIIMWVVCTALQIPIIAIFGTSIRQSDIERGEFPVAILLIYVASIVINLVVTISYRTFFVGRMGATPGKLALSLQVVRSDGSKLTYGRAFGRAWAHMINGFTIFIGYIMVAFDDQKRGLHDHICDTRVIRKS